MERTVTPDEQLKKFRAELQRLKEKYNQAKGAVDFQLKQLQEMGFDTPTEADKALTKMKREKDQLERDLKEGIKDLGEMFKWN